MSARILLVTRNFPPVRGGMERLLHHACLELAKQFDVAVAGPAGCSEFVPAGAPVKECRLSPLPAFLACLQWSALALSSSFRPQLVLAGSGVAAPAAIAAAWRAGARAACYLHGLDVIVDSAIYRSFFLPAVRRCDVLIANSRYTAGLAARAGIAAGKLSVLNPGAALPPAGVRGDAAAFRNALGAGDRPILLSVGRLHRRKGLAEFVERSLPAVVRQYPDVLLAIVGDEPAAALRGGSGERQRIAEAAARAGMQAHVRFAGALDDALLESAFAASRLLVFPVLDLPGDAEGFGMVAVEAAAHELPTVAFAVGGVPEAVEDGISGKLVQPIDYAAFTEAVCGYLDGTAPFSPGRCRAFSEEFSWDRFGERLRAICAAAIA